MLIIDDEIAVRQVVRKMLESCGYRVVEAGTVCRRCSSSTGTARHRDDIAIVLTDLMMPSLDGRTTIRELRSRCSALPIVVASGLTRHLTAAASAAEAAMGSHVSSSGACPTGWSIARRTVGCARRADDAVHGTRALDGILTLIVRTTTRARPGTR